MRLANILPGGGGWRKQETLLWQMDCATRLSVEILQLQNIPIIWNYLRDPTFSRFYTIPECDRHTHTQTLVHGVLYSPVAVIITQVLTTARQSIVCGRTTSTTAQLLTACSRGRRTVRSCAVVRSAFSETAA